MPAAPAEAGCHKASWGGSGCWHPPGVREQGVPPAWKGEGVRWNPRHQAGGREVTSLCEAGPESCFGWHLLSGPSQQGCWEWGKTPMTPTSSPPPPRAQHPCMGRGGCCCPRAGGCSHPQLCREPRQFGHLGGVFWGWTRMEPRPQSLLEARRVFPKGSASLETHIPALVLPGKTPQARVGFALGRRCPTLRLGGGCTSGL